jgi:hypothetical protein
VIFNFGELGREAWRNDCCNPLFAVDQFPYFINLFPENLRVLAAHFYTIATSDTPFRHNFCLTVADFDGFGRAFPYTGIAHPAPFPDGGNEWPF